MDNNSLVRARSWLADNPTATDEDMSAYVGEDVTVDYILRAAMLYYLRQNILAQKYSGHNHSPQEYRAREIRILQAGKTPRLRHDKSWTLGAYHDTVKLINSSKKIPDYCISTRNG